MSEFRYEDIVFLPHHQSKTRPCMTNLQRAAQFSAFAALKGFDEEIEETARHTESAVELSEERKGELGETLAGLKKGMRLSVTYFVPDQKKAGGAYLTRTGTLKRADPAEGILLFADGTAVPFDALIDLFVIVPIDQK